MIPGPLRPRKPRRAGSFSGAPVSFWDISGENREKSHDEEQI